MEKEKVCLIINPVSGTESKKNIPEEVAAAFDQTKYDVIIRITGYPDHATEIAREAVKNGFNYVLTAGGDGTVNEVAKVLINTDTTLVIIPFGSGNGLARELGIPTRSFSVPAVSDSMLSSATNLLRRRNEVRWVM